MSGYFHRIYVTELDTVLVPPRRISSGIPVWLGTAPKVAAADYYKPHLIYTLTEWSALFNADDSEDTDKYTLLEAAKIQFQLYGVTPGVYIPVAHETDVETPEAPAVSEDVVTLTKSPVKPESEVVQDSTDTTTYTRGTDYTIDNDTGVITRLADGSIAADETLHITYTWFDNDAANVDSDDVLGGVDATTGNKTGLELVERIIPTYGVVPGTLVAPGFSQVAATAIAMESKAQSFHDGLFSCFSVVDLPETVTKYSDAPAAKTSGNLTGAHMAVCWPRVRYGSEVHWMSGHLACQMAECDYDYSHWPVRSPSNLRYLITGAVINGEDVWLDHVEAEYLNGQGIHTALNLAITGAGWVSFGGRTAAYPSNTDPKDAEIHIRRMFNHLRNTLVLTYWKKVDSPVRRRLIDLFVKSINDMMKGLIAREFILGGECRFIEEENPTTDVIDGVLRFHIWFTPAPRAREIQIYTEFDPSAVATLFGE